MTDKQRLEEAKRILYCIANGINPLDGTQIESAHFLNHPQVIRPLYFLLQYLNSDGKVRTRTKQRQFYISQERLDSIVLPEGDIGINEFCRLVNEHIDERVSKKLTHKPIYDKLKQLGILDEVTTEEGKKRTTINQHSANYGIKEIQRTYNGRLYEQVVFDDVGKEFLRKNLLDLLAIKQESVLEKA